MKQANEQQANINMPNAKEYFFFFPEAFVSISPDLVQMLHGFHCDSQGHYINIFISFGVHFFPPIFI